MAEKFSYSRIDTYAQCGFRYKLRYVDKHYVNTNSLATELGTVIHAAEEAIAKSIKNGEPVAYNSLKHMIIIKMIELEHKYPEAWAALDKSNRNCREKFFEYLNSGIYRLENFMMANGHLQIVDTEKEFEFTFQDTVFHGFIDRILFNTLTNKFIVQDIKTYAVPVEKKNLETPLQFVVYTLAMKQLFGVTADQVECSYDLPFCNLIQQAGKEGFVQIGSDKLNELLSSIASKDYTPKPTPLCHWCEYCPTNPNQDEKAKNLCPYHSLWTKENKTFSVGAKWEGLDKHDQVLFEYIQCQNSSQKAV